MIVFEALFIVGLLLLGFGATCEYVFGGLINIVGIDTIMNVLIFIGAYMVILFGIILAIEKATRATRLNAKAAMEETKKRNFVPTQTDETMIDEVEQVYCLDRDDEDVQK